MSMSVLESIIFLLLSACSSASELWWKKVAQRDGPMVCAEEHVPEVDRVFSTPWTGGSLCGMETVVRFSCCPGYDRSPGETGCTLVNPLKNLAETAEAIGAKKFVEYAQQSGLMPFLTERGAYTLFVARDDAFASPSREQERALNGSKSRNRTPVLLYTIVEGRLPAEELPPSLNTLYREGTATVARHKSGLITVNCIPLVSTDIEATNGIIHVTESLLLSPGRNTISDLLVRRNSEGSPLSITSTAMARAQLTNELRDKKSITLFAPTDQAWEALPPNVMEALMDDPKSLKVLLQHHIVDSAWCSRVLAEKVELKSLQESVLHVTCNASAQYVEHARIVEKDLVARNGFVHYIDAVLIPERVQSLVEFLESRGLTDFLNLITAGGIAPLFERQDSYTIFAPTNNAFQALSKSELSDLLTQPSLARVAASYHVASGNLLTTNAIDGQRLATIQGHDPALRLKIHKKRVTVETALVTESDLKCRNIIIHIIDKVLIPPTKSLLDGLREGNFSTFLDLLNQTEPNLLKMFETSSETFTVFAPNDITLNSTMPPGMLTRLLLDPALLYKIMARHILTTFVSSSYIDTHLIYSFKSLNDELVTIRKDSDNLLTVSRISEIMRPDILFTNGILHMVSRLIEV